MKKFVIGAKETIYSGYVVEANNLEEAIEMVNTLDKDIYDAEYIDISDIIKEKIGEDEYEQLESDYYINDENEFVWDETAYNPNLNFDQDHWEKLVRGVFYDKK